MFDLTYFVVLNRVKHVQMQHLKSFSIAGSASVNCFMLVERSCLAHVLIFIQILSDETAKSIATKHC